MDDFYLNKMQKYENLCLAWIQKADQEFLNNNFHDTQKQYLLFLIVQRWRVSVLVRNRLIIAEKQEN